MKPMVPVRKANVEDSAGIGLVHVRSWQVAYRGHMPDEFLDAGALPTLHDRYGISTAEVARQIKQWL